uniref:Uncharacterized protein n=1 Tax=Monodelphis domestica TaxID=13616 RepID=F7ECQ8_MONDO
MQPDAERCRPRARKPDMALYVPKARRGSVLPISDHQEISYKHLNAGVNQGQEESHLPPKNDIFRVSSELQRPSSSPSRQEHKDRDGKRNNSKSKKGTYLKERNRGKFHTPKGTPESKEMFDKNQQKIPNPSSFSKVPSQIHFKPKKEEKYIDSKASNMTVPQALLISQSSTEIYENQAPTKQFQSMRLCDFRKKELSGMSYVEELESTVSTNCRVVETVSGSQFFDESENGKSLLNPDYVLAPTKLNSPSEIVQEIVHTTGDIPKPQTENIKSIASQGSPEDVIFQACTVSGPKNVSDLSDPMFLSSTAGILDQKNRASLSEIGDPLSNHMHTVSKLENAIDIADLTCMSGESEKNGDPAYESHMCYEPDHSSAVADESSPGKEPEDDSDITDQACMSVTDDGTDETSVGSNSAVVGGITEQACSSVNSLLDCMGVSTYITPLVVANSLECGDESSSSLTVCKDSHSEDNLSSCQESMGRLVKDFVF